MKKVLLYSSIVIVALALIVWKLNNNKKENEAKTTLVKESSTGAVPILADTATKASLNPTFTANGNFTAVEQIDFAAESAGRIIDLMVKEGSVVRKGQALARIDNQVTSAELE